MDKIPRGEAGSDSTAEATESMARPKLWVSARLTGTKKPKQKDMRKRTGGKEGGSKVAPEPRPSKHHQTQPPGQGVSFTNGETSPYQPAHQEGGSGKAR